MEDRCGIEPPAAGLKARCPHQSGYTLPVLKKICYAVASTTMPTFICMPSWHIQQTSHVFYICMCDHCQDFLHNPRSQALCDLFKFQPPVVFTPQHHAPTSTRFWTVLHGMGNTDVHKCYTGTW